MKTELGPVVGMGVGGKASPGSATGISSAKLPMLIDKLCICYEIT